MSFCKLALNPDRTEYTVFGSKTHPKLSSYFLVNILSTLRHPADIINNFDADFSFSEHIQKTC